MVFKRGIRPAVVKRSPAGLEGVRSVPAGRRRTSTSFGHHTSARGNIIGRRAAAVYRGFPPGQGDLDRRHDVRAEILPRREPAILADAVDPSEPVVVRV